MNPTPLTRPELQMLIAVLIVREHEGDLTDEAKATYDRVKQKLTYMTTQAVKR